MTALRTAQALSVGCLVLIGSTTWVLGRSVAQAQGRGGPWTPVGPGVFRLAVASVLVAPGKRDGGPWDGPGRLPPEVAQALQQGITRSERLSVSRWFFGNTGAQTIGAVLPWAINAFSSGEAAPDVRLVVHQGSRLLFQTRQVRNTSLPTWDDAYSQPLELTPGIAIVVRATDLDLMFNDAIGECTATPPLRVNRDRYIDPAQWDCQDSQLWAVRMRVEPAQ